MKKRNSDQTREDWMDRLARNYQLPKEEKTSQKRTRILTEQQRKIINSKD